MFGWMGDAQVGVLFFVKSGGGVGFGGYKPPPRVGGLAVGNRRHGWDAAMNKKTQPRRIPGLRG